MSIISILGHKIQTIYTKIIQIFKPLKMLNTLQELNFSFRDPNMDSFNNTEYSYWPSLVYAQPRPVKMIGTVNGNDIEYGTRLKQCELWDLVVPLLTNLGKFIGIYDHII